MAARAAAASTAARRPHPSSARTGRSASARPTSPLPQMRADDGDLARLTDRSWSLLFASNAPPWLYRCGGGPSWVERDDDGRPVPRPMTEDRLRHVLAQLVNWRKRAPNGDLVPAYPPPVLLKNLLATPDPALPVLAGIVTAPVFGSDGTLITEPGYHPAARLLYEPAPELRAAAGPGATRRPQQIAAARSLLLDDLLGDFPFVGDAERAHALALLLLPFVRPMIAGPTPLHMVEKPAPGTGATLMVDAISIIATGTSASVMVEGRDEDEWRKRLTAKLREIPSILLIDNLRRQLDASSVAAALTAPYWEDRVLGKSEMVRFPIRCVWIATGNNPQFSNEIARRMVRIRLDPHEDQPWLREGFRHPNLLAWVWQNRARLVAACLTLGRAWIAAGMPRHQKTIGSFEGWARGHGRHPRGRRRARVPRQPEGDVRARRRRGRASGAASSRCGGTGSAPSRWASPISTSSRCKRSIPLARGDEHAKRTSLGQALGAHARSDLHRRRSAAAGPSCRLGASGAQRWQLEICRTDAGSDSPGSPRWALVDLIRARTRQCRWASAEAHPRLTRKNLSKIKASVGLVGLVRPLSPLRVRAHARAIEEPGKGSPSSPGSPSPGNPRASGGEPPR